MFTIFLTYKYKSCDTLEAIVTKHIIPVNLVSTPIEYCMIKNFVTDTQLLIEVGVTGRLVIVSWLEDDVALYRGE
jgi:hypothetical protein